MNFQQWRVLPLWVKVLIFPWLVATAISSILIISTTFVVTTGAMMAAIKSVTRRLRKQKKRALSVMQDRQRA